MQNNIGFYEIYEVLKKRVVIILLSAFLGLFGAFILTFFFISPKYSSSAELIVQTKTNSSDDKRLQEDVSANVMMINTYKDMIGGKMILSKVQSELQKKYHETMSITQLKKAITIDQSQNSQMFAIKVVTNNPDKSANVANTIAKVFQQSAAEVLDVNKVNITSEADPATTPISPNKKINLVMGLFLGFILGIILAFIMSVFDKTVSNEQFILDEVQLPVIGSICELSKKELNEGKNSTLLDNIQEKHTLQKNHSAKRV